MSTLCISTGTSMATGTWASPSKRLPSSICTARAM